MATIPNRPEPMGICDGQLLPLRNLSIPLWDTGLINGVIVSEQVRTFRSRPFLLERHYERWSRGLSLVDLPVPCDLRTLSAWIEELVACNAKLLPPQAEQGICFLATPGNHTAFLWGIDNRWGGESSADIPLRGVSCPNNTLRFYVHTYPLNTKAHQVNYRQGIALSSTSVCDVPKECWPRSVKIRSRLHYYLAQQQAQKLQPESFPLLLDHSGKVSDSAIGSIVGYKAGQGLMVQPKSQRFSSVSVDFLVEMASQLDYPISELELTPEDLFGLDELFLVSTPWCLFPIRELDGQPIGVNSSGRELDSGKGRGTHWIGQRFSVFRQLAAAWGEKAGTPIFQG